MPFPDQQKISSRPNALSFTSLLAGLTGTQFGGFMQRKKSLFEYRSILNADTTPFFFF